MPSRRHRSRNNKRGRNKKRLPNTRKKQPYQKGKQNHMHQNNDIDDNAILMQGLLLFDVGENDMMQLWCVLIGNILYLYHKHTTKMSKPFDVINLSNIERTIPASCMLGPSIALRDQNNNEQLLVFSNEKEQRAWMSILSHCIKRKRNRKTKRHPNAIDVFNAWSLVQNNDQFCFCDVSLLKYKKSAELQLLYQNKSIKLTQYDAVSICVENGDCNKDKTQFKYSIVLESQSKDIDSFNLFMKSKNNILELYCHLNEIVNEKSLEVINFYDDMENKQMDYNPDHVNAENTEMCTSTRNVHGGSRVREFERLKSKFVIDVKQHDDNDDDDDTDIDHDGKNDSGDVDMDPSTFAFGENFLYYDYDQQHSSLFISPKYCTLKDELLQNPYFTMTNDEYLEYFFEAYRLMQTPYIQSIKAYTSESDLKKSGIEEGSALTVNHIICLLTYCNNDGLQRILKQHCRRRNARESLQALTSRHSFVANWGRYLRESAMFYGEHMKTDESFYCGMNHPLLLNGVNLPFDCPLSTTTSILVANSFATDSGIILKLQAPGNVLTDQNRCRYFNLERLSQYANEIIIRVICC
eukprot:190880_1